MTKRTMPALYEKMRTRPGAPPAELPARHVEPSPRPIKPAENPTNWLGPGRTVRLPVGYVLLAAATMLALVIATYVLAFQRGRTVGKADIKSQMISDLNGSPESRVASDPLYELNANPSGSKAGNDSLSGANRRSAAKAPGRPASAWGPVVVDARNDPRKKGLNYFVLIETQEAGARKVADFCRSNGLETYVVPGKNDRRRVIVCPGFEAAARLSPDVKALEDRIQEVGDKWKKAERGNSDFRGAYPYLFSG